MSLTVLVPPPYGPVAENPPYGEVPHAMASQNEIQPKDDLGTDIRVGAMAPPELLYPTLPNLRKELEQCKKDVCNFPFLPKKPSPERLYPLGSPLRRRWTGACKCSTHKRGGQRF
jgi:hypothetical protein